MEIGRKNQLRKGRFSEANRVYHVTTVTVERVRIFSKLATGRLVVEALQREQAAGHARTLAFVVMPDHLHWLVELRGTCSLSMCVGRVKSRSSRFVNRAVGRAGRLWVDGFHDHAMRRDEDVVNVARYIIANPLRAGLVDAVGDYPLWDSVWL